MAEKSPKSTKESRPITLARSTYQPSKAELEKTLEFPKGTTPDDLAEALTQTVGIT